MSKEPVAANGCQTSTNQLYAKDELFFQLSMLNARDQLRVVNAATQIANKLVKMSPEQRANTKIHGCL